LYLDIVAKDGNESTRFGSTTLSSYLCTAAHSGGESLRIVAEVMMPWDRNKK
jgi:hypothetical protein